MDYALGRAVFEIVDALRDDTTYLYQSADQKWSLRVTPVPQPKSAAEELQLATQAFLGMFGGAVVYCDPTQIQGGPKPAKGYEGEIHDGSSSQRFAIWALEHEREIVVLFLIGDRRGCLPEAARITASASFLPASRDPAPSRHGLARRRARTVSFEIPADWSAPQSLFFTGVQIEDLRVRITIGEGLADPNESFLERELPAQRGDEVEILHDRRPPVPGHLGGWIRELEVRHRSVLGEDHVELRKASLRLAEDVILTAYAKAPTRDASALQAAWAPIVQTSRART